MQCMKSIRHLKMGESGEIYTKFLVENVEEWDRAYAWPSKLVLHLPPLGIFCYEPSHQLGYNWGLSSQKMERDTSPIQQEIQEWGDRDVTIHLLVVPHVHCELWAHRMLAWTLVGAPQAVSSVTSSVIGASFCMAQKSSSWVPSLLISFLLPLNSAGGVGESRAGENSSSTYPQSSGGVQKGSGQNVCWTPVELIELTLSSKLWQESMLTRKWH